MAHIQTGLPIVLATQFQDTESILVGSEATTLRLVQEPGRPLSTTLNPPVVTLKWQGWNQTPSA